MTREHAKELIASFLKRLAETRTRLSNEYLNSEEYYLTEATFFLADLEKYGFQPPKYNKEHESGYDEVTGWEGEE
jgi:hypothetical protein